MMLFWWILGFGLPWILIFAWGARIIIEKIVKKSRHHKNRRLFFKSMAATKRWSKFYRKKYKGVEIGEYDG